MLTKDLPEQVTKLKTDLRKRVEQFNKETGLTVSGVMVEATFTEALTFNTNKQSVVKAYQVGISIEL